MRKKKKGTTKCGKIQSHVMLVLHNVRMVPSNVRKKNKGTTECDKSTVTYNVGTIKCEKKKKPQNVVKYSHI